MTAIPFPFTVPAVPRSWRVVATRYRGRRDVAADRNVDRWLDQRSRVDLRGRWQETAGRVGLGRAISTPLGGVAIGALPTVEHIESGTYGEPAHLIVKLRPGQLVLDLEERRDELAAGLGVWSLRFCPRGGDFVRVDLIGADPLGAVVPWLPDHCPGDIVIGVDEHRQTIAVPIADITHMTVQGATRSGKSTFAYGLLGQLHHEGSPFVDIVGVDPTGLTLGPFGEHPRGWRVTGPEDAAERYEHALTGIVGEMERRIATMPPRHDVAPVTIGAPRLFVVLEEWPAVARLVGHTRSKPSRVHRLVARLVSEGAKANVRVITLCQRAEADVVGAFEREQSATSLTFGPANADTLKMLHPHGDPNGMAERMADSPKGVALLTMPGVDLTRIRAPWLGSYGAFCDLVAPIQSRNAA